MKSIGKLLVLCLVSVSSCVATQAQEHDGKKEVGGQKIMKFKAGDVVLMREVGALITAEKGKLKVMMMPPKEGRPQDMPDVDLSIGDEVGMVNGKRIKELKELKEEYERTPIGGEIKLGLRRDGQAHIISFVKKDDKDMPHGGQMIIRQGKPDDDSDVFPALGISIAKKEDDIVISETMPNAPKNMSQGDIIKTLNGKKMATIDDFNKEFDATKIGSTLTFGLSRGGKTITVVTPRPQPKQQMIMRKK
jgi:S1-C subfamily serine protease